MSNAPPSLPLHVGDYLTDTGHLTIEQSGAYLHLLMYGWRMGRIPDNEGDLARLCRVTARYWRTKIAPALLPFFERRDGILISSRLEKERKIACEKIEKQRKRANAKWSSNRPPTSNENNDIAYAAAMPPLPLPVPLPLSKDKKKESVHHTPYVPKPRASDPEFDAFWAAYPRRQDRGHAEKAWATALKTAPPNVIMAGLEKYSFSPDPKFIPLAATWLNGRRWTDEPPPQPKNPELERFEREMAWGRREIERMGLASKKINGTSALDTNRVNSGIVPPQS